ncbi:MAG: hypothetical protein U0T69_04435 [Chitinophagales bacterium]
MEKEDLIWTEIACNSYNENTSKFNEKQRLLSNYIDLYTELEGGASVFVYNKIPSQEFNSYINTLNYIGLDILSNELLEIKNIMDNDKNMHNESWEECFTRLNLETKFIKLDELFESLNLGTRITDWILENQEILTENLSL